MGDAQQGGESQYAEHTEELRKFFESFQDEDINGDTVEKYMQILQRVANREERVIEVELDDVFNSLGEDMAENIRRNTYRYKQLIADAIDKCMPAPTGEMAEPDVADVLLSSRMRGSENAAPADAADPNQLPPGLKRRYEVRVLPRTKEKAFALRNVRASSIGNLLTVKGIVTRVSEVKPNIAIATYTCQKGGTEVYQEVPKRDFMPLFTCPSEACCGASGRLHLQTRGCKFVKFQEVKIQEEADQVPTGHTPRSMTLHLTGELTRTCSAGETVTASGIFLPTPYTGFKAMRAGLITDTYLEVHAVEKHKKSYLDFVPDDEMAQRIAEAADEDMYTKMAQSIAPEIFGHEDVKKALLLLLVGGVTREMGDGMKIRGDINVCLMGDPGVAKSQLLKHIATVAPRAIYTTGKGSSGVGLTAAVVRDSTTNELVLEGGALVLADMGICCIDEFDKMEDGDRAAIHEVMEQQTVSIAKAGITTTLNARTSVLAAANPAYSRYNPSKSPEENINLPAALLSRFDLLWLILDKATHEHDRRLAEHVTYVHRFSAHPHLEFEALEPQFMRAYTAHCRQYEPNVPDDVAAYIVDEYVAMRNGMDASGGGFGSMTARSLLAILRLSQALARLHQRHEVTRDDITEARRLMTLCRTSILDANDEVDDARKARDPISTVYNLIREHVDAISGPAVNVSDILPKVLARGCTKEQLAECLTEYEQLGVWMLNPERSIIRFVDTGDGDD